MRKPLNLAYCRRQAAGANCSAVSWYVVRGAYEDKLLCLAYHAWSSRTQYIQSGVVDNCCKVQLWAKSSPWADRAKTKADANRADLIGRAKEKG